jgi:hypothetical protein
MDALTFTLVSKNKKTGPIPVTTSGRETCPTDCAFYNGECYAMAGPLAGLWRGLSAAEPNSAFKNGRGTVKTIDWAELCKRIADLKANQLWRHNQAGDLPKLPGTIKIDRTKLAQLAKASQGKRGFTYTHHNVLNDLDNRAAVAEAVKLGFVINLSANNLRHADALADLGIAPVAAVVPMDITTNQTTPAGRKVVICPATIRDDVSCADCSLCARVRDFVIGFPAHGAAKRKASAIAA